MSTVTQKKKKKLVHGGSDMADYGSFDSIVFISSMFMHNSCLLGETLDWGFNAENKQ